MCQWSDWARNRVWTVWQRSASQSFSDGSINWAVKDPLNMSGLSCLAIRRINLLVPSPTLSARILVLGESTVIVNVAGSLRSVTDPTCYTCHHRLTLRCSPCGAIKESGFITPSSHLISADGYHIQNQNRKKRIFSFSLKTDWNRTGYENIMTVTTPGCLQIWQNEIPWVFHVFQIFYTVFSSQL